MSSVKTVAVRVLVAMSALALVHCADPCGRRCANDPEPSATDVARCRETQSSIDRATGNCANEVRAARDCANRNTVCNSSGRSEFAAGTCSAETSAVVNCCLRNLGQAPACLLR